MQKTLEDLESHRYLLPQEATTLVKKIYQLRKKKLVDYTIEDLRLMIGQNQGIEYLVPLAIEYLKKDPFIEGDFYEGDLLVNVLICDCSFWNTDADSLSKMKAIVNDVKSTIGSLDISGNVSRKILNGIITFEKCK